MAETRKRAYIISPLINYSKLTKVPSDQMSIIIPEYSSPFTISGAA